MSVLWKDDLLRGRRGIEEMHVSSFTDRGEASFDQLGLERRVRLGELLRLALQPPARLHRAREGAERAADRVELRREVDPLFVERRLVAAREGLDLILDVGRALGESDDVAIGLEAPAK